jgi:hypothetical protein
MKKIMIGTVGLFLFAAGPVFPGSSTGFSASQPQLKTYGGISYVSGGFGEEERENLRAMSKNDNLELSFALQNKNYLSGAKMVIKDGHGKDVLETVSEGPLLSVKIPEGSYTVEATAMGQTLVQTAHVPPEGQAQLYSAWKESKEDTPSPTVARN